MPDQPAPDFEEALAMLERAERWVYEHEDKDCLAHAAAIATARADLRRKIEALLSEREAREERVSALREAVWQIANNVPEHEGETDTSYEEWARSFAAAAIAYDDSLKALPATESAQADLRLAEMESENAALEHDDEAWIHSPEREESADKGADPGGR